MVFRLQAELAPVMDGAGNLSQPALDLYGPALDARIAQARGLIQVEIRDAPPWVAEAVLAGLRSRTAAGIAVTGRFALYRGRLFYRSGAYSPPQLALDMEELTRLAELPRPGVVVPPGVAGLQRLVSAVYITEAGEIAGVEIARGQRVPEIEAELSRARVIAPGLRGTDPVAAVAMIEIPYRPRGLRPADVRGIP